MAVGWFDAATDLLGLHSIWADWQLGRSAVAPAAEAMEAVIVLMRTAPRLGQGKCLTLVGFEAYRQEWLLRCRETLAQESLWSGVSGTPTGARRLVVLRLPPASSLVRSSSSSVKSDERITGELNMMLTTPLSQGMACKRCSSSWPGTEAQSLGSLVSPTRTRRVAFSA